MKNLFTFSLGGDFAQAECIRYRYKYALFLNLETKSDIHFLYLDAIFRQNYCSLIFDLA